MQTYLQIPEDNKMRIVEFCADWCGHCRLMAQIIERAEKENPNIEFIKIDVDRAKDRILDEFKVDELPLIVAVKNGKEVSRYSESDGPFDSWVKFIQW